MITAAGAWRACSIDDLCPDACVLSPHRKNATVCCATTNSGQRAADGHCYRLVGGRKVLWRSRNGEIHERLLSAVRHPMYFPCWRTNNISRTWNFAVFIFE